MNSFSELVEALNLKTEFDEVFSEIPFESQTRLKYKSLTSKSASFFDKWSHGLIPMNENQKLLSISSKYLQLTRNMKKNYKSVMNVE